MDDSIPGTHVGSDSHNSPGTLWVMGEGWGLSGEKELASKGLKAKGWDGGGGGQGSSPGWWVTRVSSPFAPSGPSSLWSGRGCASLIQSMVWFPPLGLE